MLEVTRMRKMLEMTRVMWIFEYLTWGPFGGPLSADFRDVKKLAGFCSVGYFEF